MRIVEYNNANSIIVEFQDEYKAKVHTTYSSWKKDNIFNPYNRDIFGKGCIGNAMSKIKGVKKDSYKVWYAMLQRCYSECYKSKPTYIDCNVCDQWLIYENFEKWYNDNFYKINKEQMMLDKDILCKGNKIYDEEHCVFVPQCINKLFTKRQLHRGQYPIGVTYDLNSNMYIAKCNTDGKSIYLGSYNTPYEAFIKYKTCKEKYIKILAERYKDKIPIKLYDAMCAYEVEITD